MLATGAVKAWMDDRGFGFITGDDGKDVFVHVKQLPKGVRALKLGDRVSFERRKTNRGVQAFGVQLLNGDAPVDASSEEWADVITEGEYRRELTKAVPQAQPYFSSLVQLAQSHGWLVLLGRR